MTDPTSRQRGRPDWTEQKISYKEKKNIWSWAPGGCSIPRLTDWLTDRQSQCDLDLDLDSEWYPCGGGVENLHCDPASRRRRWKGKSQIWDRNIWSRVPRASDPRKTALARYSSIYQIQTCSLVREGAHKNQVRNCKTVIKIWSQAPEGCYMPRQTGRLTVGRKMRLRLRA
jgi:hypothetical protein